MFFVFFVVRRQRFWLLLPQHAGIVKTITSVTPETPKREADDAQL
jgi:hypothetical protein